MANMEKSKMIDMERISKIDWSFLTEIGLGIIFIGIGIITCALGIGLMVEALNK